jgi:hypothetical protein
VTLTNWLSQSVQRIRLGQHRHGRKLVSCRRESPFSPGWHGEPSALSRCPFSHDAESRIVEIDGRPAKARQKKVYKLSGFNFLGLPRPIDGMPNRLRLMHTAAAVMPNSAASCFVLLVQSTCSQAFCLSWCRDLTPLFFAHSSQWLVPLDGFAHVIQLPFSF